MTTLAIVASLLFIGGYILITLEHRYDLHKALPASALGAFLWILIAMTEGADGVGHAIEEVGAEIFGLIAFLLAAMTLVEILTHYRFFDLIRAKILALGLNDRKQLWVIGSVSFFLSAIIDNLTATLVMLAISMSFFAGKNLLRAAAVVVIAANAGGAWSPIGDVTTIMLWLADKFTAVEIVLFGFLPSLALFVTSTFLLTMDVSLDTQDTVEESIEISRSEKIIIGVSLISFLFPLLVSRIGLEPYFGLVFGLGLVGILIALFRVRSKKLFSLEENMVEGTDENGNNGGYGPEGLSSLGVPHQTHLTSNIEKKLARIDLASLLFFIGILLAVGALSHLGVLELISHVLLGVDPSIVRLVIGNSTLGILSAIMDNIPLTAAAIDILKTNDSAIWVLLAIAVGTGGSILVIGSAAGVVAMGKVKDLTFFNYIKIATFPAFAGYIVAIAVWYAQYLFFS